MACYIGYDNDDYNEIFATFVGVLLDNRILATLVVGVLAEQLYQTLALQSSSMYSVS